MSSVSRSVEATEYFHQRCLRSLQNTLPWFLEFRQTDRARQSTRPERKCTKEHAREILPVGNFLPGSSVIARLSSKSVLDAVRAPAARGIPTPRARGCCSDCKSAGRGGKTKARLQNCSDGVNQASTGVATRV